MLDPVVAERNILAAAILSIHLNQPHASTHPFGVLDDDVIRRV
jgi:hypothetical protein